MRKMSPARWIISTTATGPIAFASIHYVDVSDPYYVVTSVINHRLCGLCPWVTVCTVGRGYTLSVVGVCVISDCVASKQIELRMYCKRVLSLAAIHFQANLGSSPRCQIIFFFLEVGFLCVYMQPASPPPFSMYDHLYPFLTTPSTTIFIFSVPKFRNLFPFHLCISSSLDIGFFSRLVTLGFFSEDAYGLNLQS